MRGCLTFFSVGFLVAIVGFGGLYVWLQKEYREPGPLREAVLFVVEPGESLSHITKKLAEIQALTIPEVFKWKARLEGLQADLKAGEYQLSPHMAPQDILQMLTEGRILQHGVTIPEGWTSYQIVQALRGNEGLRGEITMIPKEGTLLPETYYVSKGESRADIITRMQVAMQELIAQQWDKRDENLPIKTKGELLTLASIVEKETAVPSERKRVAGVFINRLRRGMALQTDPTVIYAMTKGKIENEGMGPIGRRLLKKDMNIDSPYNTYKYPGLPPGPIANPGRDSVLAVLHPEEHDYIYFVADGSGGHAFAKTLAEHNKNVSRWRKIRKNMNK